MEPTVYWPIMRFYPIFLGFILQTSPSITKHKARILSGEICRIKPGSLVSTVTWGEDVPRAVSLNPDIDQLQKENLC